MSPSDPEVFLGAIRLREYIKSRACLRQHVCGSTTYSESVYRQTSFTHLSKSSVGVRLLDKMHQEDSTVRHTPFLFVVCAQDAVLNMSLLHVSCLHAQQGKGRQDGRMNHESTATEVRFSLRLSSAHDDGTHIRNEHKNRGNGLACFRQNEVQSQKHREVRTNSCRTAEGQSTRHLKTQIRRTNSYRLDVVRPHQLQQAVFSL